MPNNEFNTGLLNEHHLSCALNEAGILSETWRSIIIKTGPIYGKKSELKLHRQECADRELLPGFFNLQA